MTPELKTLMRSFSPLQKQVFADASATASDVAGWQRLSKQNQATTAETIRRQLEKHGSGSVPVLLSDDLVATIDEAAHESANSIIDTFALALAREIVRLGKLDPAPTYRDYRRALFGEAVDIGTVSAATWAAERARYKIPQIGRTETAVTVNLAVQLFYQRNSDLDGLAELLPYSAACPICEAGVAANPYPDLGAVEQAGPWPAHPFCIHYPAVVAPRLAADSGSLWAG